jgi:hypothetical protein
MASGRPISIPTRVRRLMPVAFIAATVTLGECTSVGSAIAQPGLDDCMNAIGAIGNVIAGNVGAGNPGLSSGNISNNNIAISSGPSNVIIQNNSGGDSANGANNQVACCINGRCCVKSGDAPATCSP